MGTCTHVVHVHPWGTIVARSTQTQTEQIFFFNFKFYLHVMLYKLKQKRTQRLFLLHVACRLSFVQLGKREEFFRRMFRGGPLRS